VDGFADRYLASRSGHHTVSVLLPKRGAQQIRTAVDGFADRYLASRSGHRFRFAIAKVQHFFNNATFLS
jgi:5-formyltetrahydrofolate cyclo-ligase